MADTCITCGRLVSRHFVKGHKLDCDEIQLRSWVLYWSPEGRPIATVQARNKYQAIRKAPQPYRKYLGEIYAEVI